MMLSLGGTTGRFFFLFNHFIFLPKLIASSMNCSYCYRKASVYDKREIYRHVYHCGFNQVLI